MMSVRLIIAAFMAFCAVSAVAQSSNSTNSSLSSSSSTGVDSSSSSVIISSSSTGGGQASVTYPDNSWQVSYILSLTTSDIPTTLPGAVTDDFVQTIKDSLNMTAAQLRPYCTSTITIPSVQSAVIAMATGNVNVTATSIVMGNLTGNSIGSPEAAANAFSAALATGNTTQTNLQAVDAGAAVPVQTATVQKAPTAPNGAASVASATLLVGSMIAAVMLML